jgi:hypothetical protein
MSTFATKLSIVGLAISTTLSGCKKEEHSVSAGHHTQSQNLALTNNVVASTAPAFSRIEFSTNSAFGRRAAAAGLNPMKASQFQVVCKEMGLDPEKTSMTDIAARKMGQDPKKVSLYEIKKHFGTDWISAIMQ